MSRTAVRAVALALVLVVVMIPATALATEAETPETTTTAAEGDGGVVPAVEAPAVEEETDDVPWTTRFLAPAIAALGVVAVVGVALYYGMRISGRYRVD